MKIERKISKITGLILALGIFLAFGNVVSAFNVGDTVEVYNTGSSGLVVRGSTACGSQIGGKFDGDEGVVLDGPIYCSGYNRWKIRWTDGLEGWSAEDWLREVSQSTPPDLTVTSVSFSPSSVTVEQSLSVTFTVKNQGGSASGTFSNRISLATSAWGTTYSLGNFAMDSLAAGASRTVTITTNAIPSSVSCPTDYYVTVFTDGFQQISESDENNNIGSSTPNKIRVECQPLRDMAVTSVWTTPSSPYVDQSTTIYIEVKNEGDQAEYNVPTKAYIDGSQIGSTQYVTLSAGQSTTKSFSWTPSTAKTYSVKGEIGIVGGETDTGDNSNTISVGVSQATYSPQVTTNAATSVGTTSATLYGNLDSTGGLASQVWFEYGTTTSYGSSTSKISKSSTGSFSKYISGLSSGTTYHFRAAASNSKGTVYGYDRTFTTQTQDTADTTLPTISISSPSNGQTFTTSTITVSGTASDNVAVNKVEVRLGSGSWQTASGTTSWSRQVTLSSGSNTIYARATDTTGNTKETSVTVNYNPPIQNNPPSQPTALSQLKSDDITSINVGETATETTVILKGNVNDPDGDTVKLQIELRRLDEYSGSFTGTPTNESDWITSGGQVSIPVYGLIDGNYHWQARTVDTSDLTSSWVSFGGNSDSASDFTVSAAAQAELITVSIDDHSAIPKEVKVGESSTLKFSFTNTGNVPWTFYAALSLKKSNGEEENLPIKPITLSPNQQGSAEWTYIVDMKGNWDVVFGVWKEVNQKNSLGYTGWLNGYIKGVTPVLQADYPGAELIPTDNKYTRNTVNIRYIIIHYMDGTLEGTIDWFKRPESEVSAHYLVGETGRIVQMVKEKDIAWHARDFNEYSIGIEHEDRRGGLTDSNWATEEMYQSSAALVRYLSEKYDIPKDRTHIVGHSEIPQSGKQDPGPYWDWDYYMQLIKSETLDTTPPTISISSPINEQTFTTQTITVRGTTADDVAVSKVEVRVGTGSWQTTSGTASWSRQVTLNEGSNTIYARATDTSGNPKETSVTANYNRPDSSLYQMPAKSGKISFFSSKDRTGECEDAAWGELLGETCGSDDATRYWYVAMRWHYAEWDSDLGKPIMKSYPAKKWWHNKRILVTNQNNGKQVVLATKDWGPNPKTGKDIDVSYTALKVLGAETSNMVNIEFADQNAALGPIQPTPIPIPQVKFIQPTIDTGGLYGFRETEGGFHLGKDYNAPTGTSVVAISDGEVLWARTDIKNSRCIDPTTNEEKPWGATVIKHRLRDGTDFYALYGHITPDVKKNGQVKQGQKVGEIQDCYIKTGGGIEYVPHLHFGIFIGDPFPTTKLGYGTTKRKYGRFVNPIEFLEDEYPYQEEVRQEEPEEEAQSKKPEPVSSIQPIIETIQNIIDKIRSLFGFS